MKQKFIYITLGLLFSVNLQAQEPTFPRHEISLGAGGGISSLQYKITGADHSMGFGGTAGIGYTFFFSKHWGLGTGVDFSLYTAKLKTGNGFGGNYQTTTGATSLLPNTPFTFSYAVNNYEEKQQAIFLNIPLMLQFQTAGKHKFYAAVGGKVGIPLSATFKADDYSVATQGYFPSYSRTIDDLPEYGLGEYNGLSNDGDLDLKTAFLASLETGVKWSVGKKNALYTGMYLDYGLNNIRKDGQPSVSTDDAFIAYNETGAPSMNNLAQSQVNSQSVTDKINPLAVGIKVKFTFGAGSLPLKGKKPAVSSEAEDAARRKADSSAAARNAEAEAKRKADEVARQARLDEEAQRAAAEKARQEEMARLQQAEAAKQQAIKTELQKPIENYHLSQTELTATQKQELDEKVILLQQNPNLKFYLYGHTCDIGGNEVNEKVGLQRAEKAKEYLVSKGISESRILGIASKRDTEPLVPNTNEENRRKNRRVEVVVR